MANLLPPKPPVATVAAPTVETTVETAASAANVVNVAGVIVNRVESVRRVTTVQQAIRPKCSILQQRLTQKRHKLRRVATTVRTAHQLNATKKIAATAVAVAAVAVVAVAARTAMARRSLANTPALSPLARPARRRPNHLLQPLPRMLIARRLG